MTGQERPPLDNQREHPSILRLAKADALEPVTKSRLFAFVFDRVETSRAQALLQPTTFCLFHRWDGKTEIVYERLLT